LGLGSVDKVPDEKTVWALREKLTGSVLIEDILTLFNNRLEQRELIPDQDQMLNASFTMAPRHRNTPEENKKAKNGEDDDLRKDSPHKIIAQGYQCPSDKEEQRELLRL